MDQIKYLVAGVQRLKGRRLWLVCVRLAGRGYWGGARGGGRFGTRSFRIRVAVVVHSVLAERIECVASIMVEVVTQRVSIHKVQRYFGEELRDQIGQAVRERTMPNLVTLERD